MMFKKYENGFLDIDRLVKTSSTIVSGIALVFGILIFAFIMIRFIKGLSGLGGIDSLLRAFVETASSCINNTLANIVH